MDLAEAGRKLELDKVRQYITRYACSDPGRTSLSSLPILSSGPDVESELGRVSEAKHLIETEGDFVLEGLFDVSGPVRKSSVAGALLSPTELLQIASSLKAARTVRSFLLRHHEECPRLSGLAEELHADKILEFNLESALDPSGTVRSTATKELRFIRNSISDRYQFLRERLSQILREISDRGFSQEDIITTREGRMVIPVKTEHKGRVPGFVHSASSSGATVFIEPAQTLDLNNEIADLQFREKREVDRILRDLTKQVGESSVPMLKNLEILARIDTLQARAKYSIEIRGREPELVSDGPIRLRGARHPLLIRSHGFDGTVPLDLDLGKTSRTLIISGPNAGGKSVAMKCVGLQCLMAQSGIHVAAGDGTALPVFDKIFVDIGDEQSVENDLSSFSSHLSNLNQIVRGADEKTLVLLDEIGGGTDPAEGGAFAAAVLETLTLRGTLTVATTHHGFLKVFAHETEGVENGAMEFDLDTLMPTYRFRSGIPGSSYALEMARRMNMEEGVVSRSREFLGEGQTNVENLIGDLERSVQRYRHELEELLSQRRELEILMREYQEKKQRFARDTAEERRSILASASETLRNANRLIEGVIREIRESGADRVVVRKARESIEGMRTELREETARLPSDDFRKPVTHGATVTLPGSSERGRIDRIIPGNKFAYVVFGNLRIKVRIDDLAVVDGEPTDTPAAVPAPDVSLPGMKDLDIRGMTGSEALPLVDKFLDGAVLSGFHRIDIIHGKGTGALRKRVQEFLSKDPRVLRFHPGEWNEGGMGATVVELRGEE